MIAPLQRPTTAFMVLRLKYRIGGETPEGEAILWSDRGIHYVRSHFAINRMDRRDQTGDQGDDRGVQDELPHVEMFGTEFAPPADFRRNCSRYATFHFKYAWQDRICGLRPSHKLAAASSRQGACWRAISGDFG